VVPHDADRPRRAGRARGPLPLGLRPAVLHDEVVPEEGRPGRSPSPGRVRRDQADRRVRPGHGPVVREGRPG
ncbi:hypothetical protein THAOC_33858, partial [Thalassiosira oceanica]